jgi:hypothetical protein
MAAVVLVFFTNGLVQNIILFCAKACGHMRFYRRCPYHI